MFRAVGVGDRLGRYLLDEELGEGGMATVFRARDVELRRDVAVKVLFPHLAKKAEVVARFHREARAAAALDHRNVLRVLDVGGGEDDEPPYIVLELIRGRSLDDSLDDQPVLAEIAAAMGVALCDALAVAHAAGIIHRDLKPANILVAEGGRLVLGDFGVAYAEGDSLVTRTGAVLGTPAFMSPEQALGDDLTARSDLYSLGATLYRIATGSLPYSGATGGVVAGILRGDRIAAERRNPAVGPELGAIIERLLATDPSARYADAKSLRAALLELTGPLGEDRDRWVERYLLDPDATRRELRPAVIATAIERARDALAQGRKPRALALANRVLELDPDHAEAADIARRGARSAPRPIAWALPVVLAAGAAIGWIRLGGQEGAARVLPGDAGAPVAAIEPAAVLLPVDAAFSPPSLPDAAPTDAAPAAPRRAARDPAPSLAPVARLADAGVPARPDAAAKLDPAPRVRPVGTLIITSDTWCNLFIDGAARGRQQGTRRIEVTAGKRSIRCEQSADGLGRAVTVEVAAGGSRRVELRLIEQVPVVARLRRGAAVRVGGLVLHAGQRGELRPGRYKAVLLGDGGEAVGSEWIGVKAGVSCTLSDTPRLGCYVAP